MMASPPSCLVQYQVWTGLRVVFPLNVVLLLSSQGLREAYGEDEPDYPLDKVKEPNPEYQL
jgi:hypothetical protein